MGRSRRNQESELSDLSEENKKIVSLLREELGQLREELIKTITERNEEIAGLRKEVTSLRRMVSKLECRVDDADAYERRDTLIFSGEGIPECKEAENTVAVVCGLVREKLKISMSSSDISTSHRLGKKPISQKPDRRKIVVKLCRRDLKRDLLYACRQVRPNFYVNENLTPIRNTIMFALRKMKHLHRDVVDGVSTMDGRVFAWIKPEDSAGSSNIKVPVNTYTELKEFTQKYFSEDLERYLQHWPH